MRVWVGATTGTDRAGWGRALEVQVAQMKPQTRQEQPPLFCPRRVPGTSSTCIPEDVSVMTHGSLKLILNI